MIMTCNCLANLGIASRVNCVQYYSRNLGEILLRSRCLNVEEDNQLVLNDCGSPVLVHRGFEFAFVKRVVRRNLRSLPLGGIFFTSACE